MGRQRGVAEHFIQGIPLLREVIPFAFVVDDQLRNTLGSGGRSKRDADFVGADLAVAVAVDNGVEAALQRPPVPGIDSRTKLLLLFLCQAVGRITLARYAPDRLQTYNRPTIFSTLYTTQLNIRNHLLHCMYFQVSP